MPKIYTKTGDKGTTSLYNGTRIGKNTIFFDILGEIDELSSRIGLVYVLSCEKMELQNEFLRTIQSTLQDINSNIAKAKVTISEDNITLLETRIDDMTRELPPLTKFILPGEQILDSHIHLCRTQTRKVERYLWKMKETVEIDEIICRYMNRLSDFFFTLARRTLI
jgi:cob(I)alamin adenosyltransferase